MTTPIDVTRRIAETVQPRLGRIGEQDVSIYPVDSPGDAPNWAARLARPSGGGHAYTQWRLDQLRAAVDKVRREMPRIDWGG